MSTPSQAHSPFAPGQNAPDDDFWEKEYERNVVIANSVWFSGLLTGKSYVPAPKKEDEAAKFDDAHLTQTKYAVPRGYVYTTSTLPPILQDKPTGLLRIGVMVYLITLAVAWILMIVAACPIPWFRGSKSMYGVNYDKVEWSLWKRKGGSMPDLKVSEMFSCPIQQQFFRCIAASMIAAACFAFFGLLTGVSKLLRGNGSYGMMLLYGLFAFGWSLCGSAMAASQYHQATCGAPRLSSVANLHVGFALSVIAWVLAMASFVALAVTTQLNIAPPLKGIRTYDTVYVVLLCIALLFTCVANAGTVFKRHFGTDLVKVVRVTYWHVEVILTQADTPIVYARHMYRCRGFENRMKASVSFLILSSCALFGAIIFGIGAFVKRGLRVASCVFGGIAFVFLAVAWCTTVAVRHSEYCSTNTVGSMFHDYPGIPSGVRFGQTKFTGYGLGEGVGLTIAAWIIVFVAVLGNYLIPWPKVKKPMWKQKS